MYVRKKIIKLVSVLIAVIILPYIFTVNVEAATFNDINAPQVFLKQEGSTTCTLCAATMMMRRTAMLQGYSNWKSITEGSLKPTAWVNGQGLKHNFTYSNITVSRAVINGSEASKKDQLISLLRRHPEGIVLYRSGINQHAILLTDYTDGIFYCADPYGGKPSGRIPLNQCLYVTISNASAYWYVSSPSSSLGSDKEPFLHNIEVAPENETVYHSDLDNISIKGWAITTYGNGSGVTCVNLCINGEDVMNCTRAQRPDVSAAYSDYYTNNAEFSCNFSASMLRQGANKISLRAYASNSGGNDILIGDFAEWTVYYERDYNLVGWVDSASGGKGTISVSGWAFDRDVPSGKINVHLYVGGEVGSGAPHYLLWTGVERPELKNTFPEIGDHQGFADTIKTDKVGEQTLYFYAFDLNGGSFYLFATKTVTIENAGPDYNIAGWVDNASGGKGTISVSGWVFDRDVPSGKINIHLYVGGEVGSGAPHYLLWTGVERPELKNTFPEIGDHQGFDEKIKTDKYGPQTLYFYAFDLNGGGFTLFATKTVTIERTYDPVGYIDGASGGVDCFNVGGWAFDEDDLSQAVDVHVYVGGEAGSGAPRYAMKANKKRPELQNTYPGIGDYHGYSETFRTNKYGTQTLYVYLINIGGGDPVLLGTPTVTIRQGHSPKGGIDYIVSEKPGSIEVCGWAYDEDVLTQSVDVSVYIGGDADSGAPFYNVKANKERAGVGNGNHGYQEQILTDKEGEQEVYIYALDIGSERPNTLLGHKTVMIQKDDSGSHTHQYLENVLKAPTCSEEGEKQYVCSCGGSYKERLPKLPHTIVVDQGREATCTETGLTEGTHCAVCDIVLNGQNLIPATGHHYGEWVVTKEATPLEDGTRQRTCNCGMTETEIVKKLEQYDISHCVAILEYESCVYDENEKQPSIIVKNGASILKYGKDYYVRYDDNINAGKALVTITGTGMYTGTMLLDFIIYKSEQVITATSTKNEILVGEVAKIMVNGIGTAKYDVADTDIITVDNKGNIFGISAGTTTITVTLSGDSNFKEASTTLNITVASTSSDLEDDVVQKPLQLKPGSVFYDKNGILKYKVIQQAAESSLGKVQVVGIFEKRVKSIKILERVTEQKTGGVFQVVSIADNAFKGNKKLHSVVIGNSVQKIGKNAFSNCKNLKTLTIGKAVRVISDKAFYNCSKLREISVKSKNLNKVGKNAILGIHKKAEIKIVKKQAKEYKKLFSKKTGWRPTMKFWYNM